MKYSIFSCLLLVGVYSHSQLNISGSFSIVAICKDGILIGADTRMSFSVGDHSPSQSEVLAYRDTIQKIFIIQNFALSVTGISHVGDSSLDIYFSDFEKTIPKNSTVLVAKDSLFNFLYNKYSGRLNIFLQQKIFIAGYENGEPTLGVLQYGEYHYGSGSGFITTNDSSGFEKKYSKEYTCEQMKPIIVDCIKSYAKSRNYTVGGPIMVLKISPQNKFSWMTKLPKFRKWGSVKKLALDYSKGKVNMNYPNEIKKNEFKKLINSFLKVH